MRSLIDILEKLDINKVSLNDKFPIDGSLDEIKTFLLRNQFSMLSGHVDSWADVLNEFKKVKGNSWMCQQSDDLNDNDGFIWSIKIGNSDRPFSKNNPLFTFNKGSKQRKDNYIIWTEDSNKKIRFLDKEEWLKLLNKQFKF